MTQIWDINLTTHIVRLTDIAPDSSRREAEFRLVNHGEVSFFDISHTLELEISSEDYSEIHRKICAEGSTSPVTSIALEGIDLIASFLQVKVEFRPNQTALRSATICVHSVRDVSVRFSTNIQGVFIGGASFTKPPSGRPAVCEGCRFYDGSSHGGNKLICGMHPSGYAGGNEKCPDWEAGEKYKRDLEITRVNESRSLSDSVRERIQVTQEQMRLAGNLARSSPGRRTIEGGQVLDAAAFAIRTDPREFNRIRGIDFRRAFFWIALEGFSGGTQERRVTGVSEVNCVLTLDRPLDYLPRPGSNWVLFQEVDRSSLSGFCGSSDVTRQAYQRTYSSDSIGRCDCLACQRERLRSDFAGDVEPLVRRPWLSAEMF